MQRVKIFSAIGIEGRSLIDASKELEKRINSYLKRYPDVHIVSVHPMMNSEMEWTEYSVLIVFNVSGDVSPEESEE